MQKKASAVQRVYHAVRVCALLATVDQVVTPTAATTTQQASSPASCLSKNFVSSRNPH